MAEQSQVLFHHSVRISKAIGELVERLFAVIHCVDFAPTQGLIMDKNAKDNLVCSEELDDLSLNWGYGAQ